MYMYVCVHTCMADRTRGAAKGRDSQSAFFRIVLYFKINSAFETVGYMYLSALVLLFLYASFHFCFIHFNGGL